MLYSYTARSLTGDEIKKGKAEVAKGHINLTTAGKLEKKLKRQGFRILKIKYPDDVLLLQSQSTARLIKSDRIILDSLN